MEQMWDALERKEGFEDIDGVVRRQLNLKGIWQVDGMGKPFQSVGSSAI